jgi:hypothetical protein
MGVNGNWNGSSFGFLELHIELYWGVSEFKSVWLEIFSNFYGKKFRLGVVIVECGNSFTCGGKFYG